MTKRYKRAVMLSVLLLMPFGLLMMPFLVWAQTDDPTPTPEPESDSEAIPFVHTVAEGENLTYIAGLYEVTVEDLLAINGLTEESVLAVGQTVIIPGGEGEAIGTLYTVQVGDTLPQVAAIFNSDPMDVLQANDFVNPHKPLLAGERLIIISRTGSTQPEPLTGRPYLTKSGDTWNTVAARFGMEPRALAELNERPYPSLLIPGERLLLPDETATYRLMPGEWLDVQLRPLPIIQGDTLSLYVENLQEGRPSGQLGDQSLRFFPDGDGYTALVGIDAFAEPETYTLYLEGSGSQQWRPFEQQLMVQNGNYGIQNIVLGPEYEPLLAPEVRAEEDAFLDTIFLTSTEAPLWEGLFQAPVTSTVVTAVYGDARSYNGGPYDVFHSGIDFAGTVGTPILAPAAGMVVFTDTLELRGLSVILDHGAGVMTAYYHLSELFVAEGDEVTQGQPIGAGGSTGLSTGPHLHWDVRVWGTAVDGQQWLQNQYP